MSPVLGGEDGGVIWHDVAEVAAVGRVSGLSWSLGGRERSRASQPLGVAPVLHGPWPQLR